MIFRLLILILLFSAHTACSAPPSSKHIFYLHGRIIELQGIHAVSERYGAYEYENIIKALTQENTIVHSDVRTDPVDFNAYCEKVVVQIQDLLDEGILAKDITIIGASKGAVMAMYIAHLSEANINYILLGANNDVIEQENDWNLHGRILGIYEKSDQVAGKNYQYWIERSKASSQFEELALDTGLDHGFLYRPIDAWLQPAKAWIFSEN